VTDHAALVQALSELEAALDPSAPEQSGIRVLGYGEISVALTTDALPGLVVKRMAGFANEAAASRHAALIERYVRAVRDAGVTVVDTDVVVVRRGSRPPTVAVVQPALSGERLGHHVLPTVDDPTLTAMVGRVLEAARRVLAFRAEDGATFAVDAQLSNWWFERVDAQSVTEPVLIDVGTPFVRQDGRLVMDRELILAAAPRVVRPFFRWAGTVDSYQDDYFDLRTTAVDLLGNFHKERCAHRLPVAIDAAKAFLAEGADGEASGVGSRPVTRAEVDRYYRFDAALLELYLRLRRADRFVQNRLLRRPYDFVMPGHVAR
jgi:hypothetical protein